VSYREGRFWQPDVTVATVVVDGGRLLMVEETVGGRLVLNQPAGHLDPRESLVQAVVRETMEEAAHDFTPTGLIGLYMSSYRSTRTGSFMTYLRFAFCGTPGATYDRPLDEGILRAVWMTYDELVACKDKHRSPLVLQCVDDYRAGKILPLSIIYTHPSVFGDIDG